MDLQKYMLGKETIQKLKRDQLDNFFKTDLSKISQYFTESNEIIRKKEQDLLGCFTPFEKAQFELSLIEDKMMKDNNFKDKIFDNYLLLSDRQMLMKSIRKISPHNQC